MKLELEAVFDRLKAAIDEACAEKDFDLAAAEAEGLLMVGGVNPHGYDLLMDFDYGDPSSGDWLELRMQASYPDRWAGTVMATQPPEGALYTYDFDLRIVGRKTRSPYSNSYQAPLPQEYV